ncbi:hypothetical protein RclHR1_12120003 [Rhizophagus clarus]|uniref:Uncharacterized protein n=1 Tax=Rhizophagus clarus TaxID=94130 RepID=A0A2Z6QIJ3_9GLOM|nr:hypothetical protein RclHR1_12120003 [Rhizophagus clarus]
MPVSTYPDLIFIRITDIESVIIMEDTQILTSCCLLADLEIIATTILFDYDLSQSELLKLSPRDTIYSLGAIRTFISDFADPYIMYLEYDKSSDLTDLVSFN